MREVLSRGRWCRLAVAGVDRLAGLEVARRLIINELFQSVQARSQVPADKRRPFYVYVDEPKVFTDIRCRLDSLFELARGLGVGLTLAAQSLTQLPTDLAQAALTNASTLVAFRQNHDDARLLARELPDVSPESCKHSTL